MLDFDAYIELIGKRDSTSTLESPDQSILIESSNNDESFEIPYKDVTVERAIEDDIGVILHSTSDLLWEGEYDATKEETISHSVPCAEIIKTLGLEQKEYDGCYYDIDNRLAAFDTRLVQGTGGVVIRKDLLDEFLSKSGMELIWIVQGEKEIHGFDLRITRWSEWEALYYYHDGIVNGDMYFMGVKN